MDFVKKLLLVLSLFVASTSVFAASIVHVGDCEETQTVVDFSLKECCEEEVYSVSKPQKSNGFKSQAPTTLDKIQEERSYTTLSGVKFGVQDCETDCEEVKVKEYSEPHSSESIYKTGSISKVQSEEKETTIEIVKGQTFGVDCSNCEEVEVKEVAKPYETQPQTLMNKITTFITNCFN